MRARPLFLAILTAAAVLAGPARPASAGSAQTADDGAPVAALPAGVARVGADLSGVVVDGAAVRDAQAAYDATGARLAAAVAARTTSEAELADLAARDAALSARIVQRTADRKDAAMRLVEARRAVQDLAVETYILSASHDELSQLLDLDATQVIGEAAALADAVEEDRRRAQEAAADAVAAASADVDAAAREREQVRQRQTEVTAALADAVAEEAAAITQLGVDLFELQQARAISTVRGTDFALAALDAYVRAAASQPRCGITWWALAGISRVEGRHGTYGGARLLADGQVSRPIIGIALTGENGTAAIGDSDGGALDGDPTVDRAVGPMQFIPETWRRWARDGDGDGDRDPQNLYDAAASAAAYLCHNRSMADEGGMRAGFFSYNHSEAYVENVLGHARRYAAFRIPPPAPAPPVAPTVP